jgi:dihydroorotase-like cyclic amidohydrolase
MRLKEINRLELPASADMHVHLRQGAMMELIVRQIRQGGVDTVFVMVRTEDRYLSVPTLPHSLHAAQPRAAYHNCGSSSGI